MGVQRAATLYARNDTTVDTGTGIDIRLLSSVAGASEQTTSCAATHTQDNRVLGFDPATTGVTTSVDVRSSTTWKKGWGTRVVDDMTPPDDTNCNVRLQAGEHFVHLDVTVTQAGGTYAIGTYSPIWFVGLLRYDPATDTATSIAGGTSNSGTGVVQPTWTIAGVGTDLGVFKTAVCSVTVAADVEFAQGEILLLQIGPNTATIPDPTLGTATWTYVLQNGATTRLAFAAGTGIRQTCALANSLVGDGVPAREGLAAEVARTATGDGDPAYARASIVAKTFDLVGNNAITMTRAGALERSVSGDGVPTDSRAVLAAKAFTVTGDGATTNQMSLGMSRSATGDGVPTMARAALVAKTFTVEGAGTVTELHPVQAYRTFTLTGVGEVLVSGANGSTITLPIDEVPTGGGGGTTIIKRPTYIFDD